MLRAKGGAPRSSPLSPQDRICSRGSRDRASTHREALHLWAKQTNPKGQTARVRAKAGGPGLAFPRTFLNTSVTSAHAAHCSHPFPTWVLILETWGAWTGHLWGRGGGRTQGNLRPQEPQSDQEEPRSGPASLACRALGDSRGRIVSTVQCTPGPAAPSLGAEDDTPATPHRGLCSSLHPPALRPALSRLTCTPLGSEKPACSSWSGYTAWPGYP